MRLSLIDLPQAGSVSTSVFTSGLTSSMQLLNLMPFPGAGIIIGFALKTIFGDKPDTHGIMLQNEVIKPMIAAITEKRYADAANLAYGGGVPGLGGGDINFAMNETKGYSNFFHSYLRWPDQVPNLFFAAMLGDAISSGNWTRLFRFVEYSGRFFMNGQDGWFLCQGPDDPQLPLSVTGGYPLPACVKPVVTDPYDPRSRPAPVDEWAPVAPTPYGVDEWTPDPNKQWSSSD